MDSELFPNPNRVEVSNEPNVNAILSQLYGLCPSIGAWAKTGAPNVLWANYENAKNGLAEYVGPRASALYMDSLHLAHGDREFLRRTSTLMAICTLADAIYHTRKNFEDGFFVGPFRPVKVDASP